MESLPKVEADVSLGLGLASGRGLGEFVRYFLASAIALLADIGALTLLTSVLGVSYLYSGAIAFTIGLIIVYVLSIRWVFDHRATGSAAKEFTLFALIGVVGLALNECILWILTGGFGVFYLYSKIASVVVVFTWNFVARKYLLFR